MNIAGTFSLVLVAIASLEGRALAQPPAEPRAYAGAGLAIAIQPEGPTDGHYLMDSTLRGASGGVHLLAGVRVAPRFSAEVEMTWTAPVSGQQSRLAPGGHTDATVEHQETIISALGRWSAGSGTWRIEPVGGWSWVITDTQSAGRFVPFYEGYPSEPFALAEGGTHTALTGGTDVVHFVSKRVAIAPFFRLHWVHRPEPVAEDWRGLSSVVYRAGVVVMGRW